MASFAQLIDIEKQPVAAAVAIMFSVVYPGCSYIFIPGSLARFEKAGRAADIFAAPPTPESDANVQITNIGTLWACFLISIVLFPLVSILIERWVPGISTRRRKFNTAAKADDATALEVKGLTKNYNASIWKRMCYCCYEKRNRPFVAVDALNFTSQKQQILCFCPQRNIQWERLTVLEHAAIWNMINDSGH
ncbi:hypothetical protein ACHAQH_009879 [Verticillium albo-atrum]